MTCELIILDAPSANISARVKAFGIGSAGCNMIARSAVPSVAFSTSEQDLGRSGAAERVLVTPEKLVGMYRTDPVILCQSSSVVGEDVRRLVTDTDVSFLMAGLGGASGSLGTAVLGQLSKWKGALTVALVASPFSAESERRREFARKSLSRIVDGTDICVVFGNDALSELAPRMPLSKAFSLMNSIMHRQMLDLATVLDQGGARKLKRACAGTSLGRFGLGLGRGDERATRAVEEAFSSPWFDFPASDADVAIVVYSTADPWDKERDRMLEMVEERLSVSKIVCGSYKDASLGDKVRLSLLLLRRG